MYDAEREIYQYDPYNFRSGNMKSQIKITHTLISPLIQI